MAREPMEMVASERPQNLDYNLDHNQTTKASESSTSSQRGFRKVPGLAAAGVRVRRNRIQIKVNDIKDTCRQKTNSWSEERIGRQDGRDTPALQRGEVKQRVCGSAIDYLETSAI